MRTFDIAGVPDDFYGGDVMGSRLVRNPMTPGMIIWSLLAIADALTPGSTSTPALMAIGVFFFVLFLLARRVLVPLPWIPERDIKLFLGASLFVFVLETLYFGGLPVLGSVLYNEFGLPVLHHIVFSVWVLPLLSAKHSKLCLAVALSMGVMMFSRQLMILALIAYLMRSGMRNVLLPIAIAASLVVLGSMRNVIHGVEENVVQDGQMVGGPLGHLLFWAFLYIVGPYTVTFGGGVQQDPGVLSVAGYWNTVPDWAILWRFGPRLSIEWSLALFYPIVAGIVVLLTRLRSFETRALGCCIHVLSFLTFFSDTLISTPVVGTFLIITFLRRGQQIGRPQEAVSLAASDGAEADAPPKPS